MARTPRRILSVVNKSELAAMWDEPRPEDGDALTYLKATWQNWERVWRIYKPRVLPEWIELYPGTRPTSWWRWDAPRWLPTCKRHGRAYYAKGDLPEPRLRIGGGPGTPACDVLAYVPLWPLGIPTGWVDFDPNNPPLYEAQAAYLKRHRLLVPGEAKRLTAKDYEPEAAVDELHDYDEEEETA